MGNREQLHSIGHANSLGDGGFAGKLEVFKQKLVGKDEKLSGLQVRTVRQAPGVDELEKKSKGLGTDVIQHD